MRINFKWGPPIKKKSSIQSHIGPSMGSSFKNWMKLIITNGSFALKYINRVATINLLSAIGIPFRIFEHWKFDRVIKQIEIKKPPIFILGHWRSGTTHLHNLLSQDPQFGYVSMLQASFPKSFLSNKLFKNILKYTLPKTRPMDNMELASYLPQEDEMALGNLFPYTLYNAFYFPKRLKENYNRFVKFKGISKNIIKKWKKYYYYLLQKATYYKKGRQLVLKNPANTARIKLLLKLFPEAKFIHIYRNPFDVYLSTWNFFQQGIRPFMLQKISDQEIQEYIFYVYKDVMKSFDRDKKFISPENLTEIRYELLESEPLAQLEKIYSDLRLNGYSKVENNFINYIDNVKSFKKNEYMLSEELKRKIEKNWLFAIKKCNYGTISVRENYAKKVLKVND